MAIFVSSNWINQDGSNNNILRQFVDYGDKWDDSGAIEEMYPYFERIYGNFYSREGRHQPKGVGISKLPDPNSFQRRR